MYKKRFKVLCKAGCQDPDIPIPDPVIPIPDPVIPVPDTVKYTKNIQKIYKKYTNDIQKI